MPLDQNNQFAVRVEELFQLALDAEPGDRAALLDQACQGDAALRKAVQDLLDSFAAVEAAPVWNAAIDMEAEASKPSSELERYRLMERIGAGGMGVVYKATRADDAFSKLVAIKIVQAVDPVALARFQQERQILAGLEHPNIARLLDGGTTPEGLPFLVMEFIDGVPIDQYIAQAKPSQADLLQLFRKICAAVSYAHGKLIVHRDLKPGNILVTKEGEPKLLDFGVAKILDGSAEHTQTGAGVMTPEYASPEQIQGGSITTSSDIYSLGVLLYELLAGTRIYRNTTNALDLAQQICVREPEPLRARTGTTVAPDLEQIVQMALRKEPDRRYASAEQFSEDIRRYLEGYPVVARPATRGYRAAKFAARNKLAIGAAALLLLTLAGGIAATAREARLANRRFNDVRKLANSYLFEFYDGIRDLPGATPMRQVVVKRALEYLDNLAEERGSDVSLGSELAAAYKRVGDAQGAPNWPNLGDRPGALASYRKALAIRQRLAASLPGNRDLGRDLAELHSSICMLLGHSGELNGAAANGRAAVAIMEAQVASQPGDDKALDVLAHAYTALGDVLGSPDVPSLGDPKSSVEMNRKALHIREQLRDKDPTKLDRRTMVAVNYGKIAAALQSLDDKPGAAAAFRRAIEIDEQLLRENPTNVLYQRETAVYNRSLSMLLLRTGPVVEARKHGDRSAELFQQLAKIDPKNVEAQEALADSTFSQGYVLAKSNDDAGAMKLYDQAIALYQDIIVAHPGILPAGMRSTYMLAADLRLRQSNPVKAIAAARKEIEITDAMITKNSANAAAMRFRGTAYMHMGKAHELLATQKQLRSEWTEARNWYQRGLAVWLELRKRGTLIPAYASRPDEALKLIEKCDAALVR